MKYLRLLQYLMLAIGASAVATILYRQTRLSLAEHANFHTVATILSTGFALYLWRKHHPKPLRKKPARKPLFQDYESH